MNTNNTNTANTESPRYCVVINQEEQYSVWPAHQESAPGWTALEKTGSKEECVAYIEAQWRDMRPKSLRDQMTGQ